MKALAQSAESKQENLQQQGVSTSNEPTADGRPSPSPAHNNYELGKRGEKAAVAFLKRQGFEILETNWTCFAGEADIIAKDGTTLCFIEVKTRTGIQKGFPEESITARKRSRYERIAACYLQGYDEVNIRVRFDVISILVVSENRAFLRMHTNAFGQE